MLVAYSLLAAVYLAWSIFFLPFCLHLRVLKSEHWTPMLLDACLGAYVIVLFLLLRNSPVCKSK